MGSTYKKLLVAVDTGLLLYWAAVFLGAHLTRVGSRIGDLVLTVGLILTFCAGFMAISFWSFYRDFDPLWWGPNALLMIIPALAFGSMVCWRLETAENRA